MQPVEPTIQDDCWDMLQGPNRPNGKIGAGFRILLAALDLGWKVEEPVYLRPRWSDRDLWVYHFILQRTQNNKTRIITISKNKDITSFIKHEGWNIDQPHR